MRQLGPHQDPRRRQTARCGTRPPQRRARPPGAQRRRWALSLVALLLAAATSTGAFARPLLPTPEHHVFREHGGRELRARWIRALVQDRRGMLWVGTQEGLYRYDGAEAVLMGEPRGLPTSYVLQLTLGPRGRVWVALGDRIARQGEAGFVTVLPEQSSACASSMYELQRMAFTAEDDLLASSGCGLLRLRAPAYDTVERLNNVGGLPEGAIDALHVAADGTWWIASARRIVRRSRDGTVDVALPADDLGEPVLALATTSDGRTWARSRSFLYRLDPGTEAFVTEPGEELAALDVAPPLETSKGRLLLPTLKGLAVRASPGKWETIAQARGLPGSTVSCALEDREGAIWLGVLGAGLVRWRPNGRWRSWTQAEGLPHDSVWGMVRDREDRLWVGTNDGLGIWDPSRRAWLRRGPDDGLPGQLVWGFATEGDGTIWAVMRRRAVARFPGGALKPSAVELPPECGPVPTDVSPGWGGAVLLAGSEGICEARSTPAGVDITPWQPPLPVEQCSDLVERAGEAVWGGGRGGLWRSAGGGWMHFYRSQGWGADSVLALAPVSAESAWISYSAGRGMTWVQLPTDKQAKPGEQLKVRHVRHSDGLPSNHVWLLQVDRWGKVWAGGPRGLAVREADGSISRHDSEEGLIWDDVNQGALLFDKDGAALVGTSRGMARFDPNAEVEETPPTVAITSVRLGAVERTAGQLTTERPVEVGYEEGLFNVQMACVSYGSPEQVVFEHRLLGAEDAETLGSYRTLHYPSLPPGSYRFQARCRSASGLWSEERASFAFRVLPPWWHTGWVQAGILLALAMALFAVVKRREGQQLARRRELEAEVAERSARLADANRLLEELSSTDPLTGLYNRRYLEASLPSDAQRAIRRHQPTHLGPPGINQDILFLLVDLDHFKEVNDTWGHGVGDEVLVETAHRLRACMRASDLVVRWGGEEFLLVCRDAERNEAPVIAARLLRSIGARPFETSQGQVLQRTCSIGWAAFPFCSASPGRVTTEQIISLADKALYRAKETGRNRALGVLSLPEGLPETGDLKAVLEQGLKHMEGRVLRLLLTPGPKRPKPPT